MVVDQVFIWLYLNRLIRRGQHPNVAMRYFNVLLETSFPTIVIAYVGWKTHLNYALYLPYSLLYVYFIILSTLRLDPRLSLFTGALAAFSYLGLSMLAMDGAEEVRIQGIHVSFTHHLERFAILMTSGVAAAFVAREIRRRIENAVRTFEERARILEVFGQQVSPSVVERLLDRKPITEMRVVCVMFLDIRDFTTYSESRSPEEVVRFLNSLWEFMVDAVNRNHGIVNKFLGDGFMAVFGAPLAEGNNCANALKAAREIVAEVERAAVEHRIPATRVGIGLHAGEAVTGNIGSALRKEYTIIGDVVNLASRIESQNKTFGSSILASKTVLDMAGEPVASMKELGPVSVKGRAEPVPLIQVA